jgi:hypothetical protein
MTRTALIVALLLAVGLAITGCGGSSSNKKSPSASSSASTTRTGPPTGAPSGATRFGPGGPPGTAPAGPQPTHGIGALVVRRSELAGFTAQGKVSTATAPTAFAANKGIPSNRIKKEAARLTRARVRGRRDRAPGVARRGRGALGVGAVPQLEVRARGGSLRGYAPFRGDANHSHGARHPARAWG